MIAQGNVKEEVRAALSGLEGGDLAPAADSLLGALGYHSERTPRQSGRVDDFISQLPAPKRGTSSEQEFRKEATAVHVVFQFTDTEIAASTQTSLLDDTPSFDEGNAKSFSFTAVDLQGESYPRGKYAAFTREVNKRMSAPVVVLFRNGTGNVTLAFAHRRQNRRNPERDVLGNVSLIREMDAADPHRAHLDILAELSLPQRLKWMASHDKQRNFDGLLAAWLDALDTEELNRRFYRELFGWFERAVEQARFPQGEAKSISREEHVIRLITRLLFVWFIKEKGLVAEDLFVEERVEKLLKDYDRDAGESYYRAVLQNLFFATLNTETGRRRFSGKGNPTHRDFSLYRYRKEIADENRLLELFGRTPFINGGLFDCLDSEAATGNGGYRIDCFSDVHYHKLSIPNRLFFGESGVIDLFERYKFTVEENTPAEQEVALDPELLGKVFENLLAANTPETQESARKKTGSYYTPRAVVDYMVDEAVVGALARKARPADGAEDFWQERLRYLLDYEDAFDDAETLFTPEEREGVVCAIAGLRVLDPAVGSGAFPMGILHKLTLALRRLDTDNRLWEQLQREKAGLRAEDAFHTEDSKARKEELAEISDTFERYRDSDFGRKLYLIQNSIYGVDIQPIACQIAKLRFFISLAIEQQPDEDAKNKGIKPLPNLETRFVAANTLVGLHSLQETLKSERVEELQRDLLANRERHFHANARSEKLKYSKRDNELRTTLATELKKLGMPTGDADKYAAWEPYDQSAGEVEWFDAAYMFGVRDGFDLVIGNPPYVESRNNLLSEKLKDLYGSQVLADWGEKLPRGSDLLIYFYARTPKVLNDYGQGYFITQNAWLSTDYGKKFQDFSLGKLSFRKIVDTSAKFFSDTESQNINAIITSFGKQSSPRIEFEIADAEMRVTPSKTIPAKDPMKWGHLFSMPKFFQELLTKMSARSGGSKDVTFGQGLNFPLERMNDSAATVPIILSKDSEFVAISTDNRIHSRNARKNNKIPALIMPRGIGERHYCTFNLCKAFSYSHVEMYLPTNLWNSPLHYCLWAYMNSSLVWLFRESTGRKNLGGGMLKAEATDMKALPIDSKFDFADDAKKVFDTLKERIPLPVSQEVCTKEHLLIDGMVSEFFKIPNNVEKKIRKTLVEQVHFRGSRSRS